MLFNSIDFLLFFPAVCLAYFIIPRRLRTIWLLGCSYFFYMCWEAEYALLLFASTLITYLSGIGIARSSTEKRKKAVVALSFAINLGILFFFKYFGFAADLLEGFLGLFGLAFHKPAFDLLLPVGISFYTFQALSYTMDVYRGEVEPEKNFFKYALFVSFFPQLVAGPIERSKNLLCQVDEDHPFEWDRVRSGLLLMLYGYFQKVVLASYLAIVVDSAYDQWEQCTGYQLFWASVCFAFQIYCDFGGYSNIAVGAAEILGFRLMDNFNKPYFSVSVADFWRRWHISLTSWFRDYLYIPLGGNRKGRIRKWINCMTVFLLSGLWHGASLHFVAWGGLNGLYQIVSEWTSPLRQGLCKKAGIRTEAFSHKLARVVCTFFLVDISWIFFRAQSVREGLGVLSRCLGLTGGEWLTWGDNLSKLGLEGGEKLNVLLLSMLILFTADLLSLKGIRFREWLKGQGLWLRWLLCYAAVAGILIFGIYGPEYDAQQFIYFQF